MYFIFFFFNDTATTEIYTLSLHDALPISNLRVVPAQGHCRDPRHVPAHGATATDRRGAPREPRFDDGRRDRKSTRLNSSHLVISYAVFCLKKKETVVARECYVRHITQVVT